MEFKSTTRNVEKMVDLGRRINYLFSQMSLENVNVYYYILKFLKVVSLYKYQKCLQIYHLMYFSPCFENPFHLLRILFSCLELLFACCLFSLCNSIQCMFTQLSLTIYSTAPICPGYTDFIASHFLYNLPSEITM